MQKLEGAVEWFSYEYLLQSQLRSTTPKLNKFDKLNTKKHKKKTKPLPGVTIGGSRRNQGWDMPNARKVKWSTRDITNIKQKGLWKNEILARTEKILLPTLKGKLDKARFPLHQKKTWNNYFLRRDLHHDYSGY